MDAAVDSFEFCLQRAEQGIVQQKPKRRRRFASHVRNDAVLAGPAGNQPSASTLVERAGNGR